MNKRKHLKLMKKLLKRIRLDKLALKIQRRLARLANMEAHQALRLLATFLHLQVKIRPRLRLISKILLVMIVTFALTSKAVAYLKPKETKIKINGQTILIANKSNEKNEEEFEINQAVNWKRSPFEFKKPVEAGVISQGYSFYHRAVDIATALGSPIHPLGSGTVEFAGRVGDGKGNIVVINHGEGLKSLYAHMGRITVGVGDGVNSEMTIGTVGLTGRTSGAHVHVELYDNDKMIDPTSVLPE